MTMDYEGNDAAGMDEALQGDSMAQVSRPVLIQAGLQAGRTVLAPNADGMVQLPAGVSIEDIRVEGRDLVITLPDGTVNVVEDGAVFLPEFVVDGIAVPSTTLSALLLGTEPEAAAGPAQSSGGNFADPEGVIGDPYGLGDLLPPTGFGFGALNTQEIYPFLLDQDEEPTISIISENNPAGAVNATADVDEAGLPARNGEPEGTNASANSETTTGSILFTPGNEPTVVTINGTAVTAVGQTIAGQFGVLTITSIAPGSIGYSYTLSDNTNGNNTQDVFTIRVVDSDGDAAEGTLTVAIVDDVPTANNDADIVLGRTFGPATGNVLTDVEGDGGADIKGADGAVVNGIVSGTADTFISVGSGPVVVNGIYGVLTINANGSYSYVRNPGTPGGVRDVFTYRIVDGDGDTDTATLTITIEDAGTDLSVPGIEDAGTLVDEAGLPSGSNAAANSETTSGTITFETFDGFGGLTINGVAVTAVGQTIAGQFGTLTITGISNGSITYSYTLTTATQGDATSESFTVTVADLDGDTSSATLTIAIVDDVPSAVNDTDTIPSATFGPATGNVVTDSEGDGGADTPGADGISVTAAGTDGDNLVALSEGALVINGTYGVLTINADGSYSYTRNVNTPGGVTEVFTYQVTDGDGDTDTATLTIAIEDAQDTITFVPETGDGTVVREPHLPDRDGEPAGSDFDGNAEATTGTITFKSPDGVASVTLAGVVVTPNALPQTIVSDGTGTLVVTAYSYDPVTGEGSLTYTYTLNDNTLDPDGTTVPFDIVVVDLDGDVASDTVTITIIDDVPTAADDTDSLTEGGPVSASGNVITDAEANGDNGADVTGADGAVVQTPGSFNGTYGTLVLNADGSYTYTLSAFGISQLSTLGDNESFTEVFDYVLVDGDGDISPATLTITLNGTDDGVTINGLDGEAAEAVLDEDDLANLGDDQGSDQSDPTSVTGSFGVTSPDGLDDVQVNGVNVVVDGVFVGSVEVANDGIYAVSITGWTPVFAADGVTVISATFSYSASLLDNTLEHDTLGQDDVVRMLTVTADDSDGSNDTASLDVQIIDDVPTANDDSASPAEDTPVIINALANDVTGADGVDLAAGVAVATNPTKGVVVYNGDGTFTYTPTPGQEGSDSFTYTITDGDGDTSTATVTISLATDSTPTIADVDLIVNEDGLPARDGESAGTESGTATETDSGSFTITTGNDTIGKLEIQDKNGVWVDVTGATVAAPIVVQGVNGALTVTSDGNGSYSYSYTLADNLLTHTDTDPSDGDGISDAADSVQGEAFAVRLTDSDGDEATETLEVAVLDDAPVANNDGPFTVAEDTPLTITTALGNDQFGADSVNLATGVVVASQPTKGSVVYNGDGTFTYTPTAGQEGPDSFTYTITDGDGDTSTATITLSLAGDSEPLVGTPDNLTVDEDGLPGANVDADPLQGDPAETDSTESATDSGSVVVSFFADVPQGDLLDSIVLVDTPELDGQLVTLAGDLVTFALVNGDLVGSTAEDGEVIRISITGATLTGVNGGVEYSYSVTLSQPVQHADAGNNENTDLLSGITFEVTDSDGDKETGSFDVTVIDDVPSLDVTKGAEAGVVLTTQDAETDGNPTDTDTATSGANFGGVFGLSFTTGADGAATPSLSFALSVTNSVSGLFSHGAAINLYLIDGKVVGSTAANQGAVTTGNTVFDLSVSSTGVVTLNQYQQVDHAAETPSDAPFDDQFAVLADGKIALTASSSITDGDGDTATDSETVDLGGNIRFADDGPTVAANAAVQLDDDALTGGNPGGTGDVDPNTANTSGTLGHSFGADGAGSIAFLTTGAPTGFTYELSGTDLLIKQGGITVITVTVNATTGAYTVTQNAPISHPAGLDENDVSFTVGYRVTDADGDTANGSLTINVDDDTPVSAISVTGFSIAHDETPGIQGDANDVAGPLAVFAGVANPGDDLDVAGTGPIGFALSTGAISASGSAPGADGGTTVISLEVSSAGVDSGLDTTDGQNILLYKEGALVVGRVGGPSGVAAFALAVDASSGQVSLVQYLSIKHPTGGLLSPDESVSIAQTALIAKVTVTDGDGDVATTQAAIGNLISFQDDAPAPFVAEDTFIINAPGQTTTVDLNFAAGAGADGVGTGVFDLPANGQPAVDTNNNPLSFMGDPIYLFGDGTSFIIGSTNPSFNPATFDPNNPDASVIFTIELNASGDAVLTVLQAEVSNGIGFDETDITGAIGGGNSDSLIIGLDTNNGAVDVILDTPTAGGTVNTSQGRIGLSGGNSISDNEAVTIDFAVNVDTSDDANDINLGALDPELTGLFADEWFYTTSFEQTVNRINGSNTTAGIIVEARLEGQDALDIPLADRPMIIRVVVRDELGSIMLERTTDGSANGVTVDFLGDGRVDISGIQEGWSYFVETDVAMTGLLVTGEQNAATDQPFTLGAFTLGGQPFEPFTLETNIIATDGDGDSQLSPLSVTFLPDNTPATNFVGTDGGETLNGTADDNILAGLGGTDTLNGGDGNDTLYGGGDADTLNGGNGNDVLVGGSGVDTLTGGAGNDSFVIDDNGFASGTADLITDFATGDVIDLSQIITLTLSDSPSSFIRYNSTSGLVQVNVDGVGTDWVTVAQLTTLKPASIAVQVDGLAAPFTVNSSSFPIALDLNGDGEVSFLSLAAGVAYDYDGDGVATQTAWVAPEDGLLARQTEDGGFDIVFTDDAAGATTDLDGLAKAYDSNGDGQFTAADKAFDSFGVWQDANSNGVVDAGEFTSLAKAGITAINLTSDGQGYTAANGDVTVYGTGSFTIKGATGALADAAFATGGNMAANDGTTAKTEQQLQSQAVTNALVAASLVAGIGLAALPEQAEANGQGAGLETADLAFDAPKSVASVVADGAAPEQAALGEPASQEHGNGFETHASLASGEQGSGGPVSVGAADEGSDQPAVADLLSDSTGAGQGAAVSAVATGGEDAGAAMMAQLLSVATEHSRGALTAEDLAALTDGAVSNALAEGTANDVVDTLIDQFAGQAQASSEDTGFADLAAMLGQPVQGDADHIAAVQQADMAADLQQMAAAQA